MGIQVEYSHHEVAPSQHEIDLKYNEALAMADTVNDIQDNCEKKLQDSMGYMRLSCRNLYSVKTAGDACSSVGC